MSSGLLAFAFVTKKQSSISTPCEYSLVISTGLCLFSWYVILPITFLGATVLDPWRMRAGRNTSVAGIDQGKHTFSRNLIMAREYLKFSLDPTKEMTNSGRRPSSIFHLKHVVARYSAMLNGKSFRQTLAN